MKPILLVEDDQNDVLFMQHALKKAGILRPVQVVPDGRQAVDYFMSTGAFSDRDRFPAPCLVLLDLNLPGMTGLEFLEWLRNQHAFKGVIVIAVTSSTADSDVERAYALGVNSYVSKPSNPAQLIEFALLLKEYWLRWNHPSPECAELSEPDLKTA